MIKAYFFDWMGTLADSDESKITKKNFINFMTNNLHNLLLIKKLEDMDITKEQKKRLYNYNFSNQSKHWLYPDTKKFIYKLKLKGYKLAIISNMYEISSNKIKAEFPEFLKQFDIIVFSSEVGMKKPDPKIYLYALNKLNKSCNLKIKPEEVMFCGDKKSEDFDGPIKVGMQAKAINRTKQKLEDIIY